MKEYFVTNFPLLCICVAMICMGLINYRSSKRNAKNILVIVGLCLFLSITVALETYAKTRTDLIVLASVMCYLGYVVRPVCLFFFIRMADKEKLVPYWVFFVLIGINALIYAPSLFVGVDKLSQFAFYFTVDEVNNVLVFNRGYVNFSSHIISALFLAYILFISFRLLSTKHRDDALVVLTCAGFVIAAVVLESMEIATNLLNVTIAISCVFYYLFMSKDDNRRDPLTKLFNRKTYYEDLSRIGNKVVGVIQIDMNCLKYLNDTYGHEAGDKAISIIAKIIRSERTRAMTSYRVGGDEFIIFSVSDKEEDFSKVCSSIKEKVEAQGYFVSIGMAYKHENENFDTLFKISEKNMYVDKSEFYKTHLNFNRRK